MAHNALVGSDTPAILRELWDTLETLDDKLLTGLDEKLLDAMAKVDLTRIQAATLSFEELRLLFLPSEIVHVDAVLERIGKATRLRYAARVEDFERFFHVLLTFKHAKDIQNTSTAFLAMIDILEEWLTMHAQTDEIHA